MANIKRKTWNIGETCVGGTIKLLINFKKDLITIGFYKYKTKELLFDRDFSFKNKNDIYIWASEHCNSYHADKISDFVDDALGEVA